MITLDRDAFNAALGRVAKVVERRSTIPILAHLHLVAADGRLILRGTDLDLEAETEIPAETTGNGGAFTAPANLLADVVGKLRPGGRVTLETDGATLRVASGRTRVTLNTLPPEDFPDIGPQSYSHRFELAAATLGRLIAATEFAISTDETRYYLAGIFLHVVETEAGAVLRAVATDGHRMARFETAAPAGSLGMPPIIVPRKVVGEVKRLTKDAAGPIGLAVSERRIELTIAAKSGPARLSSKLIDGTFPDYQRVIPQAHSKHIAFDRETCLAAAERVATISGDRSNALKLGFGDALLRIENRSPEFGHAEDEMEVDYDGAPIEIGFNGRYLAECLGVLTGDRARIDLDSPGAPALLRAAAGDELVIVLMPMRV